MTDAIKHAIGAALLDREAARMLLELPVDDMPTSTDAEIHSAMKLLDSQGEGIDLVTVDNKTNGRYLDYLLDCAQAGFLTVRQPEYIRIVKDMARRRRLAGAATSLISACGDMSADMDAAAESIVTAIRNNADIRDRTVSAMDATFSFLDSIERKPKRKARFGVPMLDAAVGDLFGGRLVVVGARPATGKSALALSAAMASQTDGTVLFCSFEMAPAEIIGRAMANVAMVNARKIAYRELGPEDLQAIGKHCHTTSSLRMRFSDSANTPGKIRTEAIKIGDLCLIVVDYLQLMQSGVRAESRRVEVGQISRALKQLAMELQVPIIALSQLNRQSEGTASREPTMAEMRESGDIEQDADAIVLMYQPPAEGRARAITEAGYTNIRMILEKNRQGPSGGVFNVAFDGAHMRFLSVSEVGA